MSSNLRNFNQNMIVDMRHGEFCQRGPSREVIEAKVKRLLSTLFVQGNCHSPGIHRKHRKVLTRRFGKTHAKTNQDRVL